ncbi:MAG: tandem-95 repeat protein [Parabacteroides sp.]
MKKNILLASIIFGVFFGISWANAKNIDFSADAHTFFLGEKEYANVNIYVDETTLDTQTFSYTLYVLLSNNCVYYDKTTNTTSATANSSYITINDDLIPESNGVTPEIIDVPGTSGTVFKDKRGFSLSALGLLNSKTYAFDAISERTKIASFCMTVTDDEEPEIKFELAGCQYITVDALDKWSAETYETRNIEMDPNAAEGAFNEILIKNSLQFSYTPENSISLDENSSITFSATDTSKFTATIWNPETFAYESTQDVKFTKVSLDDYDDDSYLTEVTKYEDNHQDDEDYAYYTYSIEDNSDIKIEAKNNYNGDTEYPLYYQVKYTGDDDTSTSTFLTTGPIPVTVNSFYNLPTISIEQVTATEGELLSFAIDFTSVEGETLSDFVPADNKITVSFGGNDYPGTVSFNRIAYSDIFTSDSSIPYTTVEHISDNYNDATKTYSKKIPLSFSLTKTEDTTQIINFSEEVKALDTDQGLDTDPLISSITADSNHPTTESTINLSYTPGTDADNDTCTTTIQWYESDSNIADGTEITGENTTQLLPAKTTKGKYYYALVTTTSDYGHQSSTATYRKVYINNSDPTIDTTNIPTIATNEDTTSASFKLPGADADNDSLSIEFTVFPNGTTEGTLNTSDGAVTLNTLYNINTEFTFIPAENFFGSCTFKYIVKDTDIGVSSVTPVTISVISVNDIPIADPIEVQTTDEDTAIDITLSGTDVEDGTDLTYAAISPSEQGGTIEINNDILTYTPPTDFNGDDSFTYVAKDQDESTSEPVTISVTVTPVNDPPQFLGSTQYTISEVSTATQTFYREITSGGGTDEVDQTMEISIPTSDSMFTSVNAKIGTYENNSFTETEDGSGKWLEISFSLKENAVLGSTYNFTATLTDMNDSTSSTDQVYAILLDPAPTFANTNISTSVLDEVDNNGDASSLKITATIGDTNDLVTPSGVSSVTVKITDSEGNEVTTDWTIDSDFNGTTGNSTAVASYTITTNGYNTITNDMTSKIRPDTKMFTITLTAVDGNGASANQAFTITINDVDQIPTGPIALSYNTSEIRVNDTVTASIEGAATDADGDTINSYSYEWRESTGTENTVSGSILSGQLKGEEWTVYVKAITAPYGSNGGNVESEETAGTAYTVLNTAPVAGTCEAKATNEDETLTFSVADTITDDDIADELEYIINEISNIHGTISISAVGQISYTPDENYNGDASFSYYASDGTDESDSIIVSITVNAVNDAPVIFAKDVYVLPDDIGQEKTVDFELYPGADNEINQVMITAGITAPINPNPVILEYINYEILTKEDTTTLAETESPYYLHITYQIKTGTELGSEVDLSGLTIADVQADEFGPNSATSAPVSFKFYLGATPWYPIYTIQDTNYSSHTVRITADDYANCEFRVDSDSTGSTTILKPVQYLNAGHEGYKSGVEVTFNEYQYSPRNGTALEYVYQSPTTIPTYTAPELNSDCITESATENSAPIYYIDIATPLCASFVLQITHDDETYEVGPIEYLAGSDGMIIPEKEAYPIELYEPGTYSFKIAGINPMNSDNQQYTWVDQDYTLTIDASTVVTEIELAWPDDSQFSPDENYDDSNTSINFQWTEASGADAYHLQVYNSNGRLIVNKENLTTNSCNVSDLENNEYYSWEVTASRTQDDGKILRKSSGLRTFKIRSKGQIGDPIITSVSINAISNNVDLNCTPGTIDSSDSSTKNYTINIQHLDTSTFTFYVYNVSLKNTIIDDTFSLNQMTFNPDVKVGDYILIKMFEDGVAKTGYITFKVK